MSLVMTVFFTALAWAGGGCESDMITTESGVESPAELVQRDHAFLKAMREQPVATYFALREKAKRELKRGDFPFVPHRVVVERIVYDLKARLTRKFGVKYKAELQRALRKAERLLAADTPYKATVRFVFNDYLPALDLILFERHPELRGKDFHRRNAAEKIEGLLAEAPDMFFYFTFGWVNDDFFVDSRTAPMNLIGLNLDGLDDRSKPPYGDMFPMSNSEFAYHDVGHAEFTSGRDLRYLRSESKPVERVAWEWEYTRLRLGKVVEQVRARDRILAEAMNSVLFELLRERGYQFSLTVLKQELETPKWTQVLLRKFARGFYDYYGVNRAKFARLDEARTVLLKAVERFREEDQLRWIQTLRADFVPAAVSYSPALTFASGRLEKVVIPAEGPVRVLVQGGFETEIGELISAQVDPTRNSPLTENVIQRIGQVLSRTDVGEAVIQPDKTIRVHFKDGHEKPLPGLGVGKAKRKLSNIEIFKINQVLGSEERSEDQAFTVRQPARKFTATIQTELNPMDGHYIAHIHTLEGERYDFPLVELRIDPL